MKTLRPKVQPMSPKLTVFLVRVLAFVYPKEIILYLQKSESCPSLWHQGWSSQGDRRSEESVVEEAGLKGLGPDHHAAAQTEAHGQEHSL